MSLTARQRVARLVGLAAICAALSAIPLLAQPAARSRSSTPPNRSERLQSWLMAIERHEPGRDDDSMSVFDSWQAEDFQRLPIDVGTLLALMDEPKVRKFFITQEGRANRVAVIYRGEELPRIVELARIAAARNENDPRVTPEARIARNKNRILKRGAILHTDVAIEEIIGGRARTKSELQGLRAFTLYLPDGRQAGLGSDVGHWEMTRSLLDKVVPGPERDDAVRGWYSAVAAYMAGVGLHSPPHFTRGLRLFPNDADLLFLAGCLHESFAGARVQEAMQGAVLPTDVKFEVSSKRAELKDAESFFRKALKSKPDHVEAQIRLGRVLGLRGEHAEAEQLLEKAAADAKEPLLQYYALLFLGGENDALGDRVRARDAYTRAAKLYPGAQSPQIALSLLSALDGDHPSALDTMTAVLALPGYSRERMDPWWGYDRAHGRNAIADLTNAYERLLAEDRP